MLIFFFFYTRGRTYNGIPWLGKVKNEKKTKKQAYVGNVIVVVVGLRPNKAVLAAGICREMFSESSQHVL